MSDTKITAEERARWLSEAQPKNIDYYEPIDFELDKRIRNLIRALEQAESRAERAESAQLHLCQWLSDIAVGLGCACDNEAMLLAAHEIKARAEKAEAENARLTKMVDCLSQVLTGYGDENEEMSAAYWKEAASRAVADAESEVKG